MGLDLDWTLNVTWLLSSLDVSFELFCSECHGLRRFQGLEDLVHLGLKDRDEKRLSQKDIFLEVKSVVQDVF